ncbi:MAG: DNA polymerase I [Firmicutes bacterium]|nr:DNA polymerase I [Bacillota bacterium]
MEKIMLIDGNSIMNRAFYGIPPLSNKAGVPTNAIYGFLNIMFKFMDEEKPTHMAVAFDLPAPTFRHLEYEGYKGKRKEMPDELKTQMPLIKELLKKMNIKTYEKEGIEADDIIGTISKVSEEMGITPVIVSGDKDLLQLASDSVKIMIPKTKIGGTEVENYYSRDVVEKYGVTPLEFIDMKALMGDPSDNIPGVPGIGEKTAAKIIAEYKSVENAIENADKIKPKRASENLSAYKEDALKSKYLVTIVRDAELDFSPEETEIRDMFNAEAYDSFKTYEFNSMLSKFGDISDSKTEKDEIEFLNVEDKSLLDECFKKLPKNADIAYTLMKEGKNINSISVFCMETDPFYAEVSLSLSTEDIANAAKEFFEDPRYKKISRDFKSDIKLLRDYGINISEDVFDTAICGYILNATLGSYEYDKLAYEFLGETYPSNEEIFGKGKSRKSYFDVDFDKRMKLSACESKTAYFEKRKMAEKLAENEQEYLFYGIEIPLVYVLADMEEAGIKVDRDGLWAYGENLKKNIDILTEEIYELAGEEFNINSPKQLGVILFEKLGLKGGKKTKTGYSTAADVLEKLKGESELVERILHYRQLTKLYSTYVVGMLNVIDEKTQRIYSTFNQTIAATGRLSSTEPNLQNIPIRLELGRELRKVFIPEDGYVFVDADYSQIELRVLAHMSGDETLINAYKTNQDIHALTASQVFNVPYEEVTPLMRTSAKAVNFGIFYGIGAFSLSQDIGVTVKEAERYIRGFFEKYPKIKPFMDDTIRFGEEKGYVHTMFGRRRNMPELMSGNRNVRQFGERVSMNMPIQGSAADIIKIAMVNVHKALKEEGLRSRLILQVHDELLIEAYEPEAERVKEILKEKMENACQMKCPLVVDVHWGGSWFEAK